MDAGILLVYFSHIRCISYHFLDERDDAYVNYPKANTNYEFVASVQI